MPGESHETSDARGTWRTASISAPVGVLIVLAIVGGLVLAAALRWKLEGPAATYGGAPQTHAGPAKIRLLPGILSLSIGGDELYAADDPWQAYLADEQTCPGGEAVDAPLVEQAGTMVCLVNYARSKRGLQPLATLGFLNEAALAKAGRIARCLDFNHNACGEDAASEVRSIGYRGAWGENLFIAGGQYGAPRPALDGWLNSPGHRANLFRPEWRIQGIAVQKMDEFGRDRDMTLWVNQLGSG